MIEITTRTEIEAPAAAVYAYVADLANNAEWQFGVASTEWTSEAPHGVGSTYDQTMDNGLVTAYQVTAIEPGLSITVESRHGTTIPTTVSRTVQVLNESRCRVTVRLSGKLEGWRRIAKPLVRLLIRRAVESDYRRLKRHFEVPAGSADSDLS